METCPLMFEQFVQLDPCMHGYGISKQIHRIYYMSMQNTMPQQE